MILFVLTCANVALFIATVLLSIRTNKLLDQATKNNSNAEEILREAEAILGIGKTIADG